MLVMTNKYQVALLFLPLLTSLTGCTFGPCETPIIALPVILAIAPFALTAKAIDDHSPSRSNTDFILAGQILDDQGQPIPSAQADVTSWIATHRDEGFADRWEQRTAHYTVNSNFHLAIKDAQALDIILQSSGYQDQHLIFDHGAIRPPFIKINFHTYRPWNNREPGPPINIANLEDGGLFYEGEENFRPFKKEDIRIVMHRTPR